LVGHFQEGALHRLAKKKRTSALGVMPPAAAFLSSARLMRRSTLKTVTTLFEFCFNFIGNDSVVLWCEVHVRQFFEQNPVDQRRGCDSLLARRFLNLALQATFNADDKVRPIETWGVRHTMTLLGALHPVNRFFLIFSISALSVLAW
jgi:hypothetical protein